MNPNPIPVQAHLAKLAVVAAVVLALAIWAGISRTPSTEAMSKAQALAPGLSASINDVKRVRFVGAEAKPIVTLEKGEGGWVVVEKGGYPADVAKVREYLLRLADSRLLEPKTAIEKSYGKLGVEDVEKPEADGALVELEGLKEPVKLIVGHYSGRAGEGTFVRRAGDKQSWLAKGNLAVDKVAANWLRRDLADLATTRIESVELTGADGKTVRVFKPDPEQPNFQIADVPKGREPGSDFIANSLASVPGGLRFEDVKPAKDVIPPASASKARYAAFDGLVLEATVFDVDGKPHVQFAAKVDEEKAKAYIAADQAKVKAGFDAKQAELDATQPADPAAPKDAEIAPETPPSVKDPATDAEVRLAALRDEAKALNARFEGWVYVLPEYKIENMRKTMADLLKPLDAKK